MEPARIESLLETGWHLIGQLNQWLSASPQEMEDRERLYEIIRRLQLFWSKADDLNLRRMARNSLVLELFLERFCADSLQLTEQHKADLSSGISSLEYLLHEFDAAQFEPEYPDLELLQRLECQTLQATWAVAVKTRTIEVSAAPIEVLPSSQDYDLPVAGRLTKAPDHVRLYDTVLEPATDEEALVRAKAARGNQSAAAQARHLPAPPVPFRLSLQNELAGPSLLPISEESRSVIGPSRSLPTLPTRKILLVEASLFYRHLFGDVLRTAGYEPVLIEGLEGQLDSIESDPDARFCAIMLGLPATVEATQSVQRIRQKLGVHLIGLLSTEDHQLWKVEIDACILKSHPRNLLDLLERLHRPAPDQVLLTA
ncbi:hypothetical protein [Schlesneria sp.]|uniref:hypothetical protein n=1 Tax=Schlesneria sp. TaxID=2762018 RepID=UPI002F10DC39